MGMKEYLSSIYEMRQDRPVTLDGEDDSEYHAAIKKVMDEALAQREPSELRSDLVTIRAKDCLRIDLRAIGAFWVNAWRLESSDALTELALSDIQMGCERVYPRFVVKPMLCSRADGELIDAFRKRHNLSVGIPVLEAMQEPMGEHLLGADIASSWEFKNKGDAPISFVLVLKGLEIP